MDRFNQTIANFFSLDKDCILKDESYIVVENKEKEIYCILNYDKKDNFYINDGIYINFFKKDNSSFVTLEFYEKGICTTEYVNFGFDDIKTEYDNYMNCDDKEIQYKTLTFVSNKNNRILEIAIILEYKCIISVSQYLNRKDFDDLISELLNTPKAEIDLDGVTHYILKNIDSKLVVDTTSIEKWDEDLLKDSLILDFCYSDQTISIGKYKDNEYIGVHSSVVKNIEKNENTLIIYPENKSYKIEIILEPVLKIRSIFY
ncbi:hypothetical protein [Tepidibacter aestuarii]|uniref:hypothetical protein n=1 Tax=Tepidibacter aestuarii TaxID=2925782 RepID=UPI0020BFAF47|nr:hypothetical protein [Tepidibacter aestuarii]CAH2212845.1 protein of unknown function [Tepidibacter aestuarii]